MYLTELDRFRKGVGSTAPFWSIFIAPPCSTMNRRESPLGAVTNKGRSSPEATIWVCKGGTAASAVLANHVANKVRIILIAIVTLQSFRAFYQIHKITFQEN